MIRSILKLVASFWPFPVKSKLINGWGIYLDLRSTVSRGIFVKGEFDPLVFQAISKELRYGDVFLDIGANVGVYSIQSLEIVGQAGAVHAFEIDPRPLRCIEKSKSRFRYDNLTIHPVAVGASCGKVQLNKDAECGNSQVSISNAGTQVPLITLDSLIGDNRFDRVNVVKIDVEGFELEVLRGARNMLTRQKPTLIIEADDRLLKRNSASVSQIEEFLKSINYSLLSVDGTWSPTVVATANG